MNQSLCWNDSAAAAAAPFFFAPGPKASPMVRGAGSSISRNSGGVPSSRDHRSRGPRRSAIVTRSRSLDDIDLQEWRDADGNLNLLLQKELEDNSDKEDKSRTPRNNDNKISPIPRTLRPSRRAGPPPTRSLSPVPTTRGGLLREDQGVLVLEDSLVFDDPSFAVDASSASESRFSSVAELAARGVDLECPSDASAFLSHEDAEGNYSDMPHATTGLQSFLERKNAKRFHNGNNNTEENGGDDDDDETFFSMFQWSTSDSGPHIARTSVADSESLLGEVSMEPARDGDESSEGGRRRRRHRKKSSKKHRKKSSKRDSSHSRTHSRSLSLDRSSPSKRRSSSRKEASSRSRRSRSESHRSEEEKRHSRRREQRRKERRSKSSETAPSEEGHRRSKSEKREGTKKKKKKEKLKTQESGQSRKRSSREKKREKSERRENREEKIRIRRPSNDSSQRLEEEIDLSLVRKKNDYQFAQAQMESLRADKQLNTDKFTSDVESERNASISPTHPDRLDAGPSRTSVNSQRSAHTSSYNSSWRDGTNEEAQGNQRKIQSSRASLSSEGGVLMPAAPEPTIEYTMPLKGRPDDQGERRRSKASERSCSLIETRSRANEPNERSRSVPLGKAVFKW